MLSWGSDQIFNVYVPRACAKKNIRWIPPIILLWYIFSYFLVILSPFRPFLSPQGAPLKFPPKRLWVPLGQDYSILQLSIKICANLICFERKKNKNYRKMLIFGLFGFFIDFLGCPRGPPEPAKLGWSSRHLIWTLFAWLGVEIRLF